MAFVVNAHEGGNFEKVESAYAVLSDLQGDGTSKLLADCAVGCGQTNTAVVLGVLYRRDGMLGGPWMFR